MSGIGKSIEAERQKSSFTAQREEEEEIGYGYGVSFKEDENVLKLDYGGTSLAVQWLRICPPMQGVWVRSLAGDSQRKG